MSLQLAQLGTKVTPRTRLVPCRRGDPGRLAAFTPVASKPADEERCGARVGRAALAAFAVRVASAAIAYLTQVVLARWMGGTEYGIFVWVWVWVLIVGGLSALGLQVSVIRFVPEYRERGQLGLLAGILNAGRAIPVAIATAAALVGAVVLAFWGDLLGPDYREPLSLALCCLPLFTLTEVQDGIGRGNRWIGIGLVPPYIVRPLLILAGMAAARLLGLPMLATTAAAVALAATWATGLGQYLLMQRKLGPALAPPTYDFRVWIGTSLPIWFIAGCELLLQNLDVLVVSHYVDAASAGIYFAALKSIGLVACVNYAVGSAIAGRLSQLNARGDRRGVEKAAQSGARLAFWPSLLGAVALLAVGKPLLAMFGPAFADGYPLMFVLAVGLVARSVVGPAEFVLRMLGEQRLCAMVSGFTAIADLGLSIGLAPHYGATGVAVANATSLIFMAVLFYVLARRRLGFDISAFGGAGRLF